MIHMKNPELVAKVVNLRSTGHTNREIGKRVGLTPQGVCNLFRALCESGDVDADNDEPAPGDRQHFTNGDACDLHLEDLRRASRATKRPWSEHCGHAVWRDRSGVWMTEGGRR